jgi:intein/homing endonuclease
MNLIDVNYSDASAEDMKKAPFPRFIYSSSPDRGLDSLLQLFPHIRKEFPEASLHVFYGFNNWDASLRENANSWRQAVDWRNKIVADINRLQEEGAVVHYGSRSQAELAEAMKAADIWLYTTNFTETYCWLPNSLIETNSANIPIQDVMVGSQVLTHIGQYKKVTDVLSRDYKGEIIDIEATTTMRLLQCTPEHPMYAVKRQDIECVRNRGKGCRTKRFDYICKKNSNYKTDCEFLYVNRMTPQWISAGELERGDYLVYPIDRTTEDREIVEINQIINRSAGAYEIQESGIIAARATRIKRTYTSSLCNAILVNEAFMRVSGYYLAEGSANPESSTVAFSFNALEQEYIDEVQELMEDVFGMKANRLNIDGNCTSIIYNSVLLAEFFSEMFGKNAREKNMPNWFLYLPLYKQEEVLVGLLRGDGSFVKRTNSIRIELASERLIRQVWKMLLRFDIVGGMYCRSKKIPRYPLGSGYCKEKRLYYSVSFQWQASLGSKIGYTGKETEVSRSNQHSIIVDDYLFVPIRKIKKRYYEGQVYNLEVEEDRSYVVENVATHNCITALEAQLSETVIVCTKLAGLITTVGDRGIMIEGEGNQPAYTAGYRNKVLKEVCAILRDDERRAAMLRKAKAWAETQTWTNRAKEWLNIFGISHQPPLTSYYEDVSKLKEIYDPAYYPTK